MRLQPTQGSRPVRHVRFHRLLSIAALAWLIQWPAAPANAATVNIGASKDNTLYQPISGTTTNTLHFVQYRNNVAMGPWFSFTNNIQGTGTNATVTDPGAATQSNRFYRVGLAP